MTAPLVLALAIELKRSGGAAGPLRELLSYAPPSMGFVPGDVDAIWAMSVDELESRRAGGLVRGCREAVIDLGDAPLDGWAGHSAADVAVRTGQPAP